jgi:hypothetical protein
VIRELEIIFGVDPIALHLRVACKVLVLFEKLRRVAARAIVDAVAIALVGAAALALLLTATAATAAVVSLTIVHQGLYVLSTKAVRRSIGVPDAGYTCGQRLSGTSARHGRRTAAAHMTMEWP